MPAKTFIPGRSYKLTFIGDSNLHVVYQVTKRTKQFVTITDGVTSVRCKVKPSFDGTEETCLPMGSYSMSPGLYASKQVDREVGAFRSGIGV